MTAEELTKQIGALLNDDSSSSYRDAVEKLREISEALGASLPNVIVVLEPGHVSRRGQHFSLVLASGKLGLRDVLFRATVPDSGFPVSLDLFEEDSPECADAESLEKAVLGFLKNPMVAQRLRMVKAAAA